MADNESTATAESCVAQRELHHGFRMLPPLFPGLDREPQRRVLTSRGGPMHRWNRELADDEIEIRRPLARPTVPSKSTESKRIPSVLARYERLEDAERHLDRLTRRM